jgi:hypothetical protein
METNPKTDARAALLAELLGDVGKLDDKLDALPARIELTCQKLEQSLRGSAEHFLTRIDGGIQTLNAAHQVVGEDLKEMGAQFDANANASAQAILDAAKASFLKQAEQGASQALERAVKGPSDSLITRLQATALTLERRNKDALTAGREKAAVFALTVILSVVLSVGLSRYLSPSPVPAATVASLTKDQTDELYNGHLMTLVWQHLDPKSQKDFLARVKELPADQRQRPTP